MAERIPTVILSYETGQRVVHGRDGQRKLRKHYLTDAGWLDVEEMSRLTGVPRQTLVTRIGRTKPMDKQIFKQRKYKRPNLSSGNDAWRKLSGRSRPNNLDKIKLGTWEAKQCARQL